MFIFLIWRAYNAPGKAKKPVLYNAGGAHGSCAARVCASSATYICIMHGKLFMNTFYSNKINRSEIFQSSQIQ